MTPPTDVRRAAGIARVPSVRDVMQRKFVSLTATATLGDAARTLVRRGAPLAALIDDDRRFVGFVSVRGVLAALGDYLSDEKPVAPLLEYLEPDPPALREEDSLLEAIRLFRDRAPLEIALPVLRRGALIGLVSRLDVIRAVTRYLGTAKVEPATLYLSATREKDEGRPY